MSISDLYSQYQLDSLQKQIDSLFPEWDIKLYQLFCAVISGKGLSTIKAMFDSSINMMTNELVSLKTVFITILVLGILSAVFRNISELFENKQMADYGFYINYLILIIFITKIFSKVYAIALQTIDNIVAFMKIILPTYFLTVTAAGGSISSLGFYQIFLGVIYGIEAILLGVIMPIISCYTILCIVNGIWAEERLVLLLHMIRRGIKSILKVMLTVIAGTGFVQSMITPVIESLKMTTIQKSVAIIPGVGELASQASQVILGSAILIKNTVGVLILLIIIMICVYPLIKIMIIMVMVKGAAAIMGIAADKRITKTTNHIGDGILILFQISLSSVAYFMILISIIAFTTNRGFGI